MVQNKRVTAPQHWQDVRHINLVTPEPMLYQCGDMISITPKNFAEDVQALIDLMDWNEHADQPVSLIPGSGSGSGTITPESSSTMTTSTSSPTSPASLPPIPNLEEYPNLTLRLLLTDYLDIKSIPRRSFFSTIAHYTNDPMQKERLLEFTSPEYVDEFWDYTTRPRRSILEVLDEFHTVRIPWDHVPSIFPVMRGRQFSIASGGALRRNSIDGGTKFELLVAIVKYQTVIKKIREGVCTRFLSSLQPGSTLKVQLQRGSLGPTSQQQLAAPCVLIGPGTGIAPLRSLLWQKAALAAAYDKQQHNPSGGAIGPSILIFGNRSAKADFFFQDEWNDLQHITRLTVITAFSRDRDSANTKVYVQDQIRKHYSLLYHILYDLGGCVYVCGSSGNMPKAVREALIDCFQFGSLVAFEGGEGHKDEDADADAEEGINGYTRGNGIGKGFSREEAEAYLVDMERVGRYKQETW